MYLFHFSTCFEQPSAHHQENQLYQYIIWYISSLCVGGRLVCRSQTCIPDDHLHRVIYTRWCIDTIDSPDDEHWIARSMQGSEINTLKIASSWLLARIVPRCTVNKIWNFTHLCVYTYVLTSYYLRPLLFLWLWFRKIQRDCGLF
jgi:hypothetical protein